MDAYFKRHEDARLHSGYYKSYNRWADFWRTRLVGHPDHKGDIAKANELYAQALEQLPAADGNSSLYSADWSYAGPGEFNNRQIKGLVESLAIDESDPTLQTIYAGTNASGIWKTTDGGKYWQCITDRNGFSNVGVQDILIDPNNPKILYAATGISTYGRSYGVGIIKSVNAGASWSRLGFPENDAAIRRLVLQPGSSTHMVALCSQGRDYSSKTNKIYVSPNAGASWQRIFTRKANKTTIKIFTDIEFDPLNLNTIYLASTGIVDSIYSGSEIWKITNIFCGDTLQMQQSRLDILPGYPSLYAERLSLAVDPQNGDLYVSGNFSDISTTPEIHYFKLLKFNAAGNNWQTIYTHSNVIHSYDQIFSGIGIWRNELELSRKFSNVFYIGGFTLDVVDARTNPIAAYHYYPPQSSIFGPNYHVDTRALKIALDGQGNEYIFAGNDGGVSRGVLKGTEGNPVLSFKNINGLGLNITQLYGIGSPSGDPFAFGGGAQDNSGFVRDPNGKKWYHSASGDAYDIVYHPLNKNVAYLTINGGDPDILKTTDGGNSWFNLSNTIPGMPSQIREQPTLNDRPMLINPDQPNYLYVGYHDLWRGTIGSNYAINIDAWQNLTQFSKSLLEKGQKMAALAIAPSNSNIMFIGYSEPHWKTGSALNDTNFFKIFRKVWKSTDGGTTWNDLVLTTAYPDSVLIKSLAYNPLTDITIHPDNALKVWISIGCFSEPGSENHRIIYTNDGGSTWHYFSCAGLPNLPINTLIAVKNSQTGIVSLFLGNDAGVWMYENADIPQQNWIQFSNGLPRCIVTDLEYNPTARKLRAATFGRGFWETSLDCFNASDEIIAAGSTVEWKINSAGSPVIKVVKGHVIVKGTLIIGGFNDQTYYRIEMMKDKGIFVEKGGKLIIQPYSQITNHCGDRWLGIRVKGNPNASFSDLSQHGVVEINGYNSNFKTSIENAHTAIATVLDDYVPDGSAGAQYSVPTGYTGGIIKASYAVFENNYIDLNIGPSRQRRKDIFMACTFKTSGLLKGTPVYPYAHILLNDNEGVKFYRNIFISDTTVFAWPLSTGILANHAQFTVKDTLDLKNTFYNLKYGIRATAIAANRAVFVNKALFRKCLTGIYLSGMTHPKIWRSYFYVNPTDTITIKPFAGIYLDHCTDYSVTENIFKNDTMQFNPLNQPAVTIGLVVNNSGTENNLIYNNTFKNLSIGILAQNRNRSSDGSKGLFIQCNEFMGGKNDIAITSVTSEDDQGIKAKQGSNLNCLLLGNNIFTGSPVANKSIGFFFGDKVAKAVTYFHAKIPDITYGDRLRPSTNAPALLTYQETNFSFNRQTCCPSIIPSGSDNVEELKDTFYAITDSVALSRQQLAQLTDGGDTPGTVLNIVTGGPAQTPLVYQDLLNKSPYLSDTALKESVLNETLLPNAALRDILVANPQSAKLPEIADALDLRWMPFPDEMKEEVMNNKDVLGPKELLEMKLSDKEHKQGQLFSSILDSYLNASDTILSDSLQSFLQKQTLPSGKFLLASKLLSEGHAQQSLQVIQQVPSLPETDGFLQSEAEAQYQLFTLLKNRAESGAPWISTDSSSTQMLWQITGAEGTRAAMQALNILVANQLADYEEPYILPQPSLKKGKKLNSLAKAFPSLKNSAEIYPNPAHHYLILKYSFDSQEFPAQLIIFSSDAKPVLRRTLHTQADELFLLLPVLNPGTYTLTLSGRRSLLFSKPIVIY